jgi:hypothetical protein
MHLPGRRLSAVAPAAALRRPRRTAARTAPAGVRR